MLATLACNLDADLLAASLPLLEEERVEALEWSFDSLFQKKDFPEWFHELLLTYSNEGRLIGHGVFFSLFSGRWSPEQEQWLKELGRLCRIYRFDHITEHFGFMTGRNFHHGAPLGIPYTATTLAIGQDRLDRIQDVCQCPVGLENLAFSYSADEVKRHGDFLEKLVQPVNGFIILDLHNMYCQMHNFSINAPDLLRLYPLHLVREIHISGGSWHPSEVAPGAAVRRDTHDDSVPEEVFELLKLALPLCPNLKFVVMEQLGGALGSHESRQLFYKDFVRMQQILSEASIGSSTGPNSFLPLQRIKLREEPVEDQRLYKQQLELSDILETAFSKEELSEKLRQSSLAGTDWKIESWAPYMLETAMQIAQKWKKQSADP